MAHLHDLLKNRDHHAQLRELARQLPQERDALLKGWQIKALKPAAALDYVVASKTELRDLEIGESAWLRHPKMTHAEDLLVQLLADADALPQLPSLRVRPARGVVELPPLPVQQLIVVGGELTGRLEAPQVVLAGVKGSLTVKTDRLTLIKGADATVAGTATELFLAAGPNQPSGPDLGGLQGVRTLRFQTEWFFQKDLSFLNVLGELEDLTLTGGKVPVHLETLAPPALKVLELARQKADVASLAHLPLDALICKAAKKDLPEHLRPVARKKR